MSTDPRYGQSNESAILDRIAKTMGVAQNLGTLEDARRESAPRITWVWKSERYARDPAQQREEMAVGHEVEPLFDVHVWGRDYREATALRSQLLAALFNEFSPNAYELGEGKPPRDDEGSSTAVGVEIVVPIRLLKVPVPFRAHKRITLSSASAEIRVSGSKGEDPTSTGGGVVATA